MKYRVRVDLSFAGEADAKALIAHAKQLASNAISINEGRSNEEISFCELEICRHDEGLPCTMLDRLEVRQ